MFQSRRKLVLITGDIPIASMTNTSLYIDVNYFALKNIAIHTLRFLLNIVPCITVTTMADGAFKHTSQVPL